MVPPAPDISPPCFSARRSQNLPVILSERFAYPYSEDSPPHGHLACPALVGSTPILAFHLSAICWIPQVLGVKPGSALRPLPCSDVMVSGTVSLATSPRSGLGGTRRPLRRPTSERPRRAGDPSVNCQVLCPGGPILISNFLKNTGLLFFWLCPRACGILVPGPGIEPSPPAVEAWSLNHWTTREVL